MSSCAMAIRRSNRPATRAAAPTRRSNTTAAMIPADRFIATVSWERSKHAQSHLQRQRDGPQHYRRERELHVPRSLDFVFAHVNPAGCSGVDLLDGLHDGFLACSRVELAARRVDRLFPDLIGD